MSKILKDDLKFLLFSNVYQRLDSPKAKRKAFNIIESAIQCIAKKGFDQITLEMIARETAVTRPLLKHYFEDLEDIEMTSLKYIRFIYQKLTVDALEAGKDEREMLRNYVNAAVDWTATHKTHVIVWFSFLHLCGKEKKFREMNTLAVQTGFERIRSLLSAGQSNGHFKTTDLDHAAKALQLVIAGAVYSSMSEEIADFKAFKLTIEKECLRIADS